MSFGVFDSMPTCGEISCDECNERYEKAVNRIAALEYAVRELKHNFTCRCDYCDYCPECDRMSRLLHKALELVNQNQGGK